MTASTRTHVAVAPASAATSVKVRATMERKDKNVLLVFSQRLRAMAIRVVRAARAISLSLETPRASARTEVITLPVAQVRSNMNPDVPSHFRFVCLAAAEWCVEAASMTSSTIDLGSMQMVSSVTTQGSSSGAAWVTSYTVVHLSLSLLSRGAA